MPTKGAGTKQDPRVIKYRELVRNASVHYYGAEPLALVASNVTDAEHNRLVAMNDCFGFPVDLDVSVTAASTLQSMLEAYNVPSKWVRNGMTYRELLRRLSGIFQMMQNMHGQGAHFQSLNAPFMMDRKASHFKHAPMLGTLEKALEAAGTEFAGKPFYLRRPI